MVIREHDTNEHEHLVLIDDDDEVDELDDRDVVVRDQIVDLFDEIDEVESVDFDDEVDEGDDI